MDHPYNFCQKWPQLEADKLAEYYEEIKLNKKLKIEWTNPGRIDPKLLIQTSSNIESNDTNMQFDDSLNVQNDVHSQINSDKSDLFDADEDEEKNIKIFQIEETKRGVRIEKTACFDKIFNDLCKNYEINNQQFDYENSFENIQEDSNMIEDNEK
jgi:hypothetical protein